MECRHAARRAGGGAVQIRNGRKIGCRDGNTLPSRSSARPAEQTNKPATVRAFSFPPAGASKPRVLVGEHQPATLHSAVAQSVRAGASYARGRRFKSALRNPVRGPIHQPRPSASRIEPPIPSPVWPEPARWPATGRTFPGARPSGKQARQRTAPPAGTNPRNQPGTLPLPARWRHPPNESTPWQPPLPPTP